MSAPTPPKSLQDLLDRAAIADLGVCYANGVDRRDWSLYRSVFTDEIRLDFTKATGQDGLMKADDWVAIVKAGLSCFDATQHDLTSPLIRLDGDTATVRFHMIARHILGDEEQIMGGYYDHELVREASGWKIALCRLVLTWERGDRALFERAAQRAGAVAERP